MKKKVVKFAKKGGAHFFSIREQSLCTVKIKGKNTFWVTDYTNQAPSKHFGWKNIYVQHPSKMKTKVVKCAKNRRCTPSILAIIIQSLNKKEWKLLELQITQTRHTKSVADGRTDGRTDIRTNGVDQLLDLLSPLKRRRQKVITLWR